MAKHTQLCYCEAILSLFDHHNEISFSQMTKQCSFAQNAHNVLPGKI